ncbi:hypothetical protein [Terricaulis sp.]|uniref:hypothetical protein n=1 Tax=Terricaulis sp. TaxID=2768686 RepID=UPI003783A431
MRDLRTYLLLALCLGGCAISPNADVHAFAQRSASNSFEVFNRSFDSPDALVLPVVHDRQNSGPSCGAHVLASAINYWEGPNTVRGDDIFTGTPPADTTNGYSLAELIAMARARGLMASGVRLTQQDVVRELESGRPVIVPVMVPSIYLQNRSVPGGDVPVIGTARNLFMSRAGRISEWTHLALISHYLLVVGYQREDERFVVVEPVYGYRTISFDRLSRYRRPFHNAAIVMSRASPPAATTAQQSGGVSAGEGPAN